MKYLDRNPCLDYLIDKVTEIDQQLNQSGFEKDMLTKSLEFYQSLLLMTYSPMGAD